MKFAITVWIASGVGIEYEIDGLFNLHAAINRCIKDGHPFQVGHTFGNLDGTHPRTADLMKREDEDAYLQVEGGKRRGI